MYSTPQKDAYVLDPEHSEPAPAIGLHHCCIGQTKLMLFNSFRVSSLLVFLCSRFEAFVPFYRFFNPVVTVQLFSRAADVFVTICTVVAVFARAFVLRSELYFPFKVGAKAHAVPWVGKPIYSLTPEECGSPCDHMAKKIYISRLSS